MPKWSLYVDAQIINAELRTAKDRKQRWVTLDGVIHETPVPYRDAISITWAPIPGCIDTNYRDRQLAHPAIGSI